MFQWQDEKESSQKQNVEWDALEKTSIFSNEALGMVGKEEK